MMNLTFPHFDGDELRLLAECLESKWVTQGPFTKKFETLFSARHRVKHALATTSCTAALHLAALALDLKPGDEVIVPALTWVTSAHAAEYVGAKAVFADVEADTFNLDPMAFAAAITPRTRAVVVVHLFGLAAKMNEVLALARQQKLAVIEDAACAVGTTYDGRPVGSFGTIGCFSFHPRKVVTTGEGGMVTTEDDALAKRVACLRNHGATGPGPLQDPTRPYHMGTFNMLGFNLRLSDIQAAVGVAQMAKLDRLLAERQKLVGRYRELLRGVEEIALPAVPAKCGHTYQSFVIRLLKGGRERRNAVMNQMQKSEIQTRPGTHAVHRLGYYADKYGLKPGDFPVAAAAEDTTITLPLFPGMSEADQKRVSDELKAGLRA
ncbi:MAG TPA: DegT/DnrJ/EryC1/StrS family aminotransferase [Gemmataceae bacterium]|nr:DegT/DnrJ/EryC1/StrS family aminotransferase [Gemmataceae bacterium]